MDIKLILVVVVICLVIIAALKRVPKYKEQLKTARRYKGIKSYDDFDQSIPEQRIRSALYSIEVEYFDLLRDTTKAVQMYNALASLAYSSISDACGNDTVMKSSFQAIMEIASQTAEQILYDYPAFQHYATSPAFRHSLSSGVPIFSPTTGTIGEGQRGATRMMRKTEGEIRRHVEIIHYRLSSWERKNDGDIF